MPSTPPAPRNSTRRPRPKARAKPQPRPHPSDRRAGTSLQSAERHTRETLSHAKPGCSRVWPLHNWSKSETSDLDAGEGGEHRAIARCEPGEGLFVSEAIPLTRLVACLRSQRATLSRKGRGDGVCRALGNCLEPAEVDRGERKISL